MTTYNRDDQIRASLLKAVCDHPAEDAPRLQFAEYLEATGDENESARAEFIRIQCEMTQLEVPNERWGEVQDRLAVLDVNRERWADELPKLDGVRWNPIDFRRGFVWEVWCDDADAFVINAPKIFTAAPIEGLSLNRQRQSLVSLMRAPQLKRLTRLILEECELGPDDAKALGESPYVANLSHLHLFCNHLGDAGAKAIAVSPYLTNLQILDLAENGIGDAGVVSLANSPVAAGLECLGLAGSTISVAGADALAASAYLNRLTGLTLWQCNKIDAKSAAKLQKRFGNAVSFHD